MRILLTGANRGIGLATARLLAGAGHELLLTGRNASDIAVAAQRLQTETGASVTGRALDVTDAAACQRLLDETAAEPDGIDALVNNAGVFDDLGAGFFDVDEATIRRAFEVHFLGAWRLLHGLLPGMNERGFGRVVNLTSGYGGAPPGPGMTAYRVAKSAVNTLTRIAAHETRGNVKINAVDPGWVATDMGGAKAPRTPDDAARDVAHAVLVPADGPNGMLLRYQTPVDW
ncbi:SDR family NAD(P)-dependent oxidoreductase [Salinisphaera sp. P385]|uniref:SDR family NAD(P)-dependent oxidoreductase n=1 Tax=Spectribacter acetivorans TaxID=3075603 RepID=A0ABU3BCZ0_9GAMM|nr:SDR family NAD(P)-dependent oxidoreductase [Salinisphaera sp. P385]MDT0619667.1 SDR family NAD(P)-dependent oxidoreductase [Salinisphaera sp. P385]